MSDFEVFPDAELLAVNILRAGDFATYATPHIDVRFPDDAFYPGDSVGNFVGPTAIVQVQRIGGIPTERHRWDHPNLQFDVWALMKSDAHNLAQLARVVLLNAQEKVHDDPPSFLSAVDDSLGIHWEFDQLNLRPRYRFGVYFTVRNNP